MVMDMFYILTVCIMLSIMDMICSIVLQDATSVGKWKNVIWNLSVSLLSAFFIPLSGAGNRTLGFGHARQLLYHWATLVSLFYIIS